VDDIITPTHKPNFDKLYKVRPFIDALQKKFLKCYDPDDVMSADESMILFKDRSSLKQYMPKKPIRRGYKVSMLACKSAYVLKFEVYTGKKGDAVKKKTLVKVLWRAWRDD